MDVVYGSALWYSTTKVNCHHLAERLAAKAPVLFVESVGARRPRAHEWRRIALRLLRSMRPLRKVQNGLWVFSPLPLPFYRRRGALLNSRWVGWQLGVLLKITGWQPELCWVFHPMGLHAARSARARALVYYCVDRYAANPGVHAPTIDLMERELSRLADLVIVTADPLAERLRGTAKRISVLPNVADTSLFGRSTEGVVDPVLARMSRIPQPRIGYVGNLASYKVDIDLVHEIARRRRQWSLVLVGPLDQGDIRSAVGAGFRPNNVHVFEPVPHDHVPALIDSFDVCLLPCAQNEVMSASFPLKFFEYLLRGRPIVARDLPTLRPFQPWFEHAETADEFVTAIERCLDEDTPLQQQERRRFAQVFSWSARMEQLRDLRREIIAGKVSDS